MSRRTGPVCAWVFQRMEGPQDHRDRGLLWNKWEASHLSLSAGYFPFVPSTHPQSDSQPWKVDPSGLCHSVSLSLWFLVVCPIGGTKKKWKVRKGERLGHFFLVAIFLRHRSLAVV